MAKACSKLSQAVGNLYDDKSVTDGPAFHQYVIDFCSMGHNVKDTPFKGRKINLHGWDLGEASLIKFIDMLNDEGSLVKILPDGLLKERADSIIVEISYDKAWMMSTMKKMGFKHQFETEDEKGQQFYRWMNLEKPDAFPACSTGIPFLSIAELQRK